MSRRNWLHNAAFRGWLIAVLVFLPSTLSAQQEAEEVKPPVVQGEGIAVEPPAPDSQTAKPATERETASPDTVPPPSPVENKPRSKPYCDALCQEAEQREKADLKAQESMADAATDLVVITWWQFYAGAFGVAFLLATLVYTAMSVRAANESNRLNRERFIAEQRPWLKLSIGVGGAFTYEESGARIYTNITIENIGKMPATNVFTTTNFFNYFNQGIDIQQAFRDFWIACDDKQRQALQNSGFLLPGESEHSHHGLLLPQADIDKTGDIQGRKVLCPLLFVCVTYKFTLTNSLHHTVRCYTLATAGDTGIASVIFVDKGQIDERLLGYSAYPNIGEST